ncbi:hypothetical protein JOQ06_017922, partial [Pogonophryne albipinna]
DRDAGMGQALNLLLSCSLIVGGLVQLCSPPPLCRDKRLPPRGSFTHSFSTKSFNAQLPPTNPQSP